MTGFTGYSTGEHSLACSSSQPAAKTSLLSRLVLAADPIVTFLHSASCFYSSLLKFRLLQVPTSLRPYVLYLSIPALACLSLH